MAIKQRALTKLNMTKDHVLRAMSMRSKTALDDVCRDLTEIRALYREGLSQQNYAAYGEICDGLVLAVQKMMEDGEEEFQEEVFALCQELLQFLERETEKEQNFKKEIVFLPYNSSMWDSLESVWKAAHEDKEHCNAYVMPIPYADLNPDRSVAEWHCERDQFPTYVPTLDWREIDLKAWHPDVIFYHSPYDDCNLVTSVESRYYSRNLKECTDKLVYIPYFVLEEPCTEESVENFVLTPGVLNADKVIVQSEAMRELYINILTKRTNRTDRAYWEERISGAGSPKIDKVLTSKKEDFEMSEKWRRLVEGKKVILYNTSLAAMLQNSDKVCDKLRYVFGVFRNRDDVVLWWRPHPLMKSTFHSMRPQFEDEYLSLEKQYIDEGWGIYDDSSDLHRAICWSDAYYGDASSVVTLYRQTNKPLLLQGFETFKHKSYGCFVSHFAVDGDKAWFVSAADIFAGLYQVKLTDGMLSCLGELPIEYKKYHEYAVIGKINKKIVIAPYTKSNLFFEFDLERGKYNIREVSLDYFSDVSACAGMFTNVIRFGSSLFFVANETGMMVEYNGESERYICHDIWKNTWPIKRQNMIFPNEKYSQYGKTVYMDLPNTRYVVEIDLSLYEAYLHEIPTDKYKIASCSFDGKYFWVIPTDGDAIIRWEKEQGNIRLIEVEWGNHDLRDRYGINIQLNGCMVLLPRFENQVLIFDEKSEKMTWTDAWGGYHLLPDCNHYVGYCISQNDDVLYLYFCQENIIQRIYLKTGAFENIKLRYSWDKTLEDYVSSYASSVSHINCEEFGVGLSEFLTACLARQSTHIHDVGNLRPDRYKFLLE